jgi:hypothetical protein
MTKMKETELRNKVDRAFLSLSLATIFTLDVIYFACQLI